MIAAGGTVTNIGMEVRALQPTQVRKWGERSRLRTNELTHLDQGRPLNVNIIIIRLLHINEVIACKNQQGRQLGDGGLDSCQQNRGAEAILPSDRRVDRKIKPRIHQRDQSVM